MCKCYEDTRLQGLSGAMSAHVCALSYLRKHDASRLHYARCFTRFPCYLMDLERHRKGATFWWSYCCWSRVQVRLLAHTHTHIHTHITYTHTHNRRCWRTQGLWATMPSCPNCTKPTSSAYPRLQRRSCNARAISCQVLVRFCVWHVCVWHGPNFCVIRVCVCGGGGGAAV